MMDKPTSAFYDHSNAHRISTDAVIIQAIRYEYPSQHITTIPEITCDLLSYAASGHATAVPVDDFKDQDPQSLKWRTYLPPARRLDGDTGGFGDQLLYAKFLYTWQSHELVMYVVNGRDGDSFYPQIINQYVIGQEAVVNELILSAGYFTTTLHDEIWVFNQGFWQKDRSLWESIQRSLWENVILDDDMKKQLVDVVTRFLDSRSQYEKLGVPWKRGIIFHGPPGNGKTISIKATMHMLYDRKPPVPTLYVKTLAR
jgi:transitional endoplasmic reticulum ATPase